MDDLNAITRRGAQDLAVADPAPPRMEARDVLSAFFRRRRRAGLVALAALALVALATLVRGRTYEAQASVLVKYGREYVYRPEVGEQRAMVTLAPDEVLNSEAQILESEDLLRDVVTVVGVERLYPGRVRPTPGLPEAARRFRKALSVEPVRRSSVLQVAFRHRDPELAAEALHVLLDRYEEKHLQAFSDAPLEFLNKQLHGYQEKLHESERRLNAFRQERGVFDYAEQMRLLLGRRADLLAQHRQAGVELGEIERRIAIQRQALEGPRPMEVVADLEKDLVRQQGEARGRRARQASVSQLLEEIDGQIRDLERTERQLAGLVREVAEDEERYRAYRERVDDVTLATAMNRQKLSNISVIDSGAVPTKPASPRLGLTIALGIALALLSAGIYVLVSERAAQGMSTPESVERRLRLPVLVSVEHHG